MCGTASGAHHEWLPQITLAAPGRARTSQVTTQAVSRKRNRLQSFNHDETFSTPLVWVRQLTAVS